MFLKGTINLFKVSNLVFKTNRICPKNNKQKDVLP